MGYVAKLGLRCSPSVTIGEPVASNCSIVSRTASSKSSSSRSREMLPAPNAAIPSSSAGGRGMLPIGSVGMATGSYADAPALTRQVQ